MPYRLVTLPLHRIKTNPHNARTHSRRQVRQIAESIRTFGFAAPLIVDEHHTVLAGHGRLQAAELLGLDAVPAIVVEGLTDAKKRALLLADNRIAQNAGWDRELLSVELTALPELLIDDDIQIDITGFEAAEIDALHEDFGEGADSGSDEPGNVSVGPAVSRASDLWQLGHHRLICGDCRDTNTIEHVMSGAMADMVFTDPPYNVSMRNIGGRGSIRRQEFAMAFGEMTDPQFIDFLKASLSHAVRFSRDGAVHFVCMDWRHIEALCTAARAIYGEMLNLICWVKTNAGQGSFYRSQHELIGVFRVGQSQHLNTVQLGRFGRDRSNVWRYAGANTFRSGRMDDLQAHPTVKPTAMIADAIKDCTRRGDVVLDLFCGSGATLLAAERVGRKGYGIEIDPQYADVAVRRWQAATGRDAVHAETGEIYTDVGKRRQDDQNSAALSPKCSLKAEQ